jgi:predicted CoA-binding protein
LTSDVVKEILTKYKTVAVVGLSRDPEKPSYAVPEYLKNHGFRIIPINPSVDVIMGEKSYKNLLDVPLEIQKRIEIVEIFRPSQDVLHIVEQAIQLRESLGIPQVIWMQLGIVNDEAAQEARNIGITVVMDHCMMIEHKRVFGE